jgi:hypothetical protein
MSEAGHADAGNVTQDDDMQADDHYNDGLDDGRQRRYEDAVAIHRQNKEIDLDAFAAKKNLEKELQEKKEVNKKKTKSKRFDDATKYQSGGSFSCRLGKIHKDSNFSSSSDNSIRNYLL